MANQARKLYDARAKAAAASNDGTDAKLDEARKNRSSNPIDMAQRGSISAELNKDAAKYKQPTDGK